MELKGGIGKTGVVVGTIVAFTMCLLGYLFHPVAFSPIQYGICLPSPDTWNYNDLSSWIINTIFIGIIAILLFLINKKYNFIRTTEPALVVLFMVMTASGPWFTETINTSVLLCFTNVMCLGIIFDSYDSRNATQEMFILGVVIGVGSMVQYAFIPMAMVYLIWSLLMKVFRIKETLAYGAGILCPYWIAFGSGWLSFKSLHYPSITPLFTIKEDPSEFFLLLTGVALAAIIGLMVALINSIKLYAGNSKVNAMNLCINILGGACVLCILLDFDNMHSYIITLYMACAVQLANICALWNPKREWLVTVLPSVGYLTIFICSIII